MRRQFFLVLPILAAMLSVLAFGALNSVTGQNMTGNETMMTNMTNATMGGNMTGNMTNTSTTMMTNSS